MAAAKYTLKLYSVIDGGFVGKVHYEAPDKPVKSIRMDSPILTVIILDISGSMGHNVEKLTEKILPDMLRLSGYVSTSPVTLITFHSHSKIYETTVESMARLGLRCDGGTEMRKAIKRLKQVVESTDPSIPIRILTLSDGELWDQEQTVQKASILAPLLAGRIVSSRAIRYFTSCSQPDTRGLASVLQFNNASNDTNGLMDIDTATINESVIISKISSMLDNDGLDCNATMTGGKRIIQLLPWDLKQVNSVRLVKGDNVFWFKSVPQDLTINEVPVEIENCGQLTFENYDEISSRLNYLAYRLKLLKIVDSNEAVQEVGMAKAYLDKWVKSMELVELGEQITSPLLLQNRMILMKNRIKRQTKGVLYQLAEIANDEKVRALNSAQQACFLRQLDGGKLSKALARRAMGNGLDFAETLRKEVIKMSEHLTELAEVDDENHFRSFYSLSTTLGGIKALCEMSQDHEIFESMEAMDILQLINIVGIACQSPFGDYPDPMTWHIHKTFPGCFISVSDLIAAFEQSGDQQHVTVPQTSETITAVVPYFEDERIQRFLQTHAPNLLDYICSIGMRNILASVPKTYLYTLASGIWKLTLEINEHKREVSIVSFCQLVRSFNVAAGNVFKHIIQCIDKDQPMVDGKWMSFYLANNSIQNLIGPMIRLAKDNRLQTPLLPRILRALYSYEIYLTIRNVLKSDDPAQAEQKIHELFGIDLAKYGSSVGAFFDESPVDPQFHSDYHLNVEAFDQIAKSFWFVDYVTISPELIQIAFRDNAVAEMKAMPKMSDENIVQALGLSYSLNNFKLFNILQAYLFDSQSKRSNEEEGRMNIIDLGDQDAAQQFVRDYIRSVYEEDYKKRLKAKAVKEREFIVRKLVHTLLSTPQLVEFEHLLGNGILVNNGKHQIVNTSSPGYRGLAAGLANMSTDVPCRLEKIRVLLTGRTAHDQIVWNRGDVLFVGKMPFYKAYVAMNAENEWKTSIASRYQGKVYAYRKKPNRHGHSNGKPSYWAFGYQTIEEYFCSISQAERAAYELDHGFRCCGLASARKSGQPVAAEQPSSEISLEPAQVLEPKSLKALEPHSTQVRFASTSEPVANMLFLRKRYKKSARKVPLHRLDADDFDFVTSSEDEKPE